AFGQVPPPQYPDHSIAIHEIAFRPFIFPKADALPQRPDTPL
ncbi:MAG: hypothetical protein, partial [Olavius algarvensis Delta 4 endosymbiont]